MSIIYDALQKTQQNRGTPALKSTFPWLDVVLVVIICILLAVVMYAYYPLLQKRAVAEVASRPVSVQPQPIVQPRVQIPLEQPVLVEDMAYQNTHVLNGVFLSDNERIAMINNKSYRLGDMVDGMQIISLDLNSVELRDQTRLALLHSPN